MTGRLLVPFRPGDDTLRFCLYPANHCTPFDSLYRRATPLDRISAIDVQTGTKELSGAIVGVLVGFGFGIVATRAHVICGGDTSPAICSPLVGVPVGALIGALIGHQIPGWRRAP